MFRILIVISFVIGSLAFNLPSIPTDFTQDDKVLSAISDDIAKRFADEYFVFVKTGKESAALRYISQQIEAALKGQNILLTPIEDMSPASQFMTCTTCRATLRTVFKTFLDPEGELNGPNREEDTKKVVLEICNRFNLHTEEVCSGLFDLNFPYFNYIVESSTANTQSLCGSLPIKMCSVDQPEWNFTLQVDNSKPELDGPKGVKPEKTNDDYIILHLTDIHYDPNYKDGSLAQCDEPMCCNRLPKEGEDSSKLAGYWGDYRDCDSPKYMIEDALSQIWDTFGGKIDLIYHTGDVIPHNIWSTTKEGNIQILTEIDDLLREKFPDIPIYSTVGNHEPHPTNVFGSSNLPEDLSVQWLYDHIWSLWSRELPGTATHTVLKGGYYTVLAKPGLRIVALNNMDCYLYNWWVFQDGSFVIEQLQWLHDVLLATEANGEKVHILAHIPSADGDCWTVWAHEFNRIIERFSDTISGIFNGHTHKDEMNVHYSKKGYPMMVSWNGGSLTPYSNKNPNYRVYEVEPKQMQVVDHHTYIFNLTEANLQGKDTSPKWFKEYQFSTEFTDDLSPAGIDKLLIEMAKDPSKLTKFWEYKMTSADPILKRGCNNDCLMKTICRLAKSVYNEKERCLELQEILRENLEPEVTTPSTTTEKESSSTEEVTKTTGDDSTSTETTTTAKPGGDGAASIAISCSAFVGVLLLQRFIN